MVKVRRVKVVPFFILLPCLFFTNSLYAEENAATMYQQASSLFSDVSPFPHDEINKVIKDGWKEGNEGLKAILAQNKEAIEEFKKATEITYCDFSFGKAIVKDFLAEIPQYAQEIKLAKLALIEGKLYEKGSKLDMAVDNYFSVLRFTAHLGQQKDFILMSKITEIILEKLVCASLSEYAKSPKLTIPDCHQLFDTLISFQKRKVGLENALEEEKEFRKNSIRLIEKDVQQKGKYNENFYQILYEEYDRLEDEFTGYFIVGFKENNMTVFEEKFNKFKTELEEERKPFKLGWKLFNGLLGLPQGISSPSLNAKILFETSMPNWSPIVTKYYVSLTKLDALIVAIAIKLYEFENNKAPDNLQELVPAYLEKIPEDPFDNFKPLKYVKKENGWIVYSFGPDKQDDFADMEIDEEAHDLSKAKGDIVFQSF